MSAALLLMLLAGGTTGKLNVALPANLEYDQASSQARRVGISVNTNGDLGVGAGLTFDPATHGVGALPYDELDFPYRWLTNVGPSIGLMFWVRVTSIAFPGRSLMGGSGEWFQITGEGRYWRSLVLIDNEPQAPIFDLDFAREPSDEGVLKRVRVKLRNEV